MRTKKRRIKYKIDRLSTVCDNCRKNKYIKAEDFYENPLIPENKYVICKTCQINLNRYQVVSEQIYPIVNGPFAGGFARANDYEDYEVFDPSGGGQCILVHIPSIKTGE